MPWWRRQFLVVTSLARTESPAEIMTIGIVRRCLLGREIEATARLALEDNGHDPSALLRTFLRERPEGSGRELFAFCCPYRVFIDAQTKARTVWKRDVAVDRP
jgi:hypothetical protein